MEPELEIFDTVISTEVCYHDVAPVSYTHLDVYKRQHVSIYDLLNRACPKEPTDVIVLPFLQGMGGTPDVRPNARGMFYGVTMETGLPEFYRAILEGLTFEMAYNLSLIHI